MSQKSKFFGMEEHYPPGFSYVSTEPSKKFSEYSDKNRVVAAHFKYREDLANPFIIQKYFFHVYRVHGTQNDRLELTVSTQKSVLKNMHRVPRYWPKGLKICRFGLVA